ncbi:MAG: YjbQ family protein [Candidatus Omnitrophica bacterium]|nr:YjbQ family protein [Candidatus Omnitrophota bacterium]
MRIETSLLTFHTKGRTDVVDITDEIAERMRETNMQEGSVLIFASGSTCGITTIEYEPGLVADIKEFFERVVPEAITYKHDERWHDGNGHSHIRSSLLKNSLTIPFLKGELLLGTWQQVIFIEFDNKARNRKIYLQFTGE